MYLCIYVFLLHMFFAYSFIVAGGPLIVRENRLLGHWRFGISPGHTFGPRGCKVVRPRSAKRCAGRALRLVVNPWLTLEGEQQFDF